MSGRWPEAGTGRAATIGGPVDTQPGFAGRSNRHASFEPLMCRFGGSRALKIHCIGGFPGVAGV